MKMEQPPAFNPKDEKYKKVADLPKDEQKNFVEMDGGFITKEAAAKDEYSKQTAEFKNKKRPILDKLLGRNKITGIEITQLKASRDNESEISLDDKRKLEEGMDVNGVIAMKVRRNELKKKMNSFEDDISAYGPSVARGRMNIMNLIHKEYNELCIKIDELEKAEIMKELQK